MSFQPVRRLRNCVEKLPGYCDTGRARNWVGTRPDESFTLKTLDGKPIYGNFFGQSSLSQLALVHRNCIIRVAHDTDLKLFAPLGCGIQTGAGVVNNTCNVQNGDSLIVSGCGAVGMSAIMAAKARGATVIIAVDIKDSRLSLAKDLGATHVLNGGDGNLVEQIRAICPLPAGVKFAFDTSGVPRVIELMIEATGVRGKTVVVGATPPDQRFSFQPLHFLDMGKTLHRQRRGRYRTCWGKLIKGDFRLNGIVKHYHYTDFASAFEDMRSGTAIKPILVWNDI